MLLQRQGSASRNRSASRRRVPKKPFLELLEARSLLATIIDLGTLGGTSSSAEGNNASGQVVGFSETSTGDDYAFLYSNGTMTDLGTLGGSDSYSDAYGINASGQVVGEWATSTGDDYAFLYSNGTMTDLGTLAGYNWVFSVATGINASGQVVGYFLPSTLAYYHPFLYSNGTMTDLGTLGGPDSSAMGINASGQVVGDSETSTGDDHAFLYSNGTMTDLGTLGGSDSYSDAYGINDAGQVVGYSETSNEWNHAFLYSNGTMTDLGTLPGGTTSYAQAINDAGQIVGESDTSNGGEDAFLYSNGTMIDLNSLLPANSGWTLENATAINNQGEIVGSGAHNGNTRAFLLNINSADIAVKPLTWNTTNGGVDYGYTISGSDLSQPTTVDLDWAGGTTTDTILGNPIVTTTTQTAQGTYQLHATSSQLGTPPATANYLLVVADPDNLVSPTDPSKVASLALTSIIATSPTWNTTDGGVDYGYTIGSAGLPNATTVDLDWASGTTVDTVIGTPITSTTTQTAQGTYQLHATPSQLGTPPAGATYLLVVADPDNLVSPTDPSKVASLALTSIIATSPTWNTTDGGVDYGYTIGSAGLPQATTVDLDWASGTTVDTVIGTPITSTTTETAQGTYPLHATPAQLGTPPATATYLLVVADLENLVSPTDPSKVASLALTSIIATSPTWNTTDGGVDYGYTVGSAGLPNATTVDLDWASGTTVDTVIGTPITSTTTETAQGTYQLHATPAQLGTPPATATYLLVVADLENLVSPTGPSKIASLALRSIIATTPKWNTTDGGVDYGYTVGSAGLPQATTVDLDWASGTTADSVIGTITSATTVTGQGTYPLHATPSQLGTPPAGATYLLVVADPDNLVSPADPSKVASLALSGWWTGAGPDDLWSDGDNWADEMAPGAGADLVFPSGAQQLTSEDDLGLSFNSIITSDNYEFSASGFLGTNNLTVQQGSLQLDDSATVTGTVSVMSGTTLTVGASATLDDQGAITVEADGSMDDEGSVTVDANGSLSIGGRLIVDPTASLDDEGSLTVTSDGAVDDFGQVSVGDTATLTVSQGSLLVGANASLSDNGNLTVDADASLAVEGSFAVTADGVVDLLGLVSVGENATLTVNNGSLMEGASGVLDNEGDLAVGASGSLAVGGSLTLVGTSGGEGSTGDNSGSTPITPTTPASTELEEQVKQVAEVADVISDENETLAKTLAKALPEDIATVQGAKELASWASRVGYAASAAKYAGDTSVLYTALANNDQQAFAAGYNQLARDILGDLAGLASGGAAAYVTTATAVADDGASLVAVPLAELLGKVGGSFAYGLYYDHYMAAGVTAQGSALFSKLKSGGTSAASGAGGTLSDVGSVTVQATGNLCDQDAITVAAGSTLDVFGNLTEGAGGNLDTFGTVTIEHDAVLDDFSPAVIDAGGILNDDGAATVEAGASLEVVGTLDIAKPGSLDVYGATVLDATAVYQPVGTVIVRSDGYLGPPVLPGVTSEPVDRAVPAGQQVTFTAVASGGPAPTVQWQVSTDGGTTFSNIAGATSTTLTFTPTAAESGDQYRAVFTNSSGSATSAAATLTVNPAMPLFIIGEQPVFHRKTHKKGKAVGGPVLAGFTFDFSAMLSRSSATSNGSYQVDSVSTKRVKKKVERILHPIRSFSVAYSPPGDSVTLTFAGKQTFPTGGQITVVSGPKGGVTGASGAALTGNTMFTISSVGRNISAQ